MVDSQVESARCTQHENGERGPVHEPEYGLRAVHQLIETQVQKSPDSTAVLFGPRQLTYAELNRRANRLTRYLKSLSTRHGDFVGICMGRSEEMLIALLAVLKAGAAYVPLDPTFPEDRLAWMLADSGTSVVLTQTWHAPDVPETAARVVCVDSEHDEIARQSSDDLTCNLTPDDLAYVLYTSGSTGKPKGVEVSHGAVVNLLRSMQKVPGFTAHDTILAMTTLSFDIAVVELLLPLVVGGRTVIISRDDAVDGIQVANHIDRFDATVVQGTPATWRLLLMTGWKGRRGLKIFCGGEALPRSLADQLLGKCGSLWNLYGPTETAVYSVGHHVERRPGPVPIGRPIDNTEVYVLGADLKPVPPGATGELYIAGAGLARGYRNRPDLTAERFLPDPYGGRPGARMYRTGDLARVLPDETVECLGRIDNQVKIRGFRIELGEVEAALASHSAVRAAAVVAPEEPNGQRHLVANVVFQPGKIPAVGELRAFLATKLPDYMVPADFVSLDALPLTPSGKVDRRALLDRRGSHLGQGTARIAPRDRIEFRLTQIFERILGRRPIGIRDNIFDLGMHSLRIVELFADIGNEFGDRLPLGALFQFPTIEQIADQLRQRRRNDRCSSLVPIQVQGSRPPLFCVHGGAGTIFGYHGLARFLGPDQPIYGLQVRGLYGGASLQTSVEDMAAHYVEEIRTVQPQGPYLLAGYCFGSIVAFEMARQLRDRGQEVAAIFNLNGPSPQYARRLRARQAQRSDDSPQGGRMLRLDPPARHPWVGRISRGVAWRWRNMGERLRAQYCQVGSVLHLPVRQTLRNAVVRDFTDEAEVRYVPRPYSGRMIIIRGRGLYDDPQLGWGDFVGGEIETYDVPGDHYDYRMLIKEPGIRFAGERLNECLQNVLSRQHPCGAAISDSDSPQPPVKDRSAHITTIMVLAVIAVAACGAHWYLGWRLLEWIAFVVAMALLVWLAALILD